MQQNSGRNSAAFDRLSQQASQGLQNEDDMLKIARSASSAKNTDRARTLLLHFASKLGTQDPNVVSPQSSKLLLNLLYSYCKTGSNSPLSIDSLNAMVQGLRNVYSSAGHRGAWRVDANTNSASGNPLQGNEDITLLRSSHKVHLSRLGKSKKRARPLPIALVCEHALRYWFGCGKNVDFRDVLLHAAMILGLNLGLRYDELGKMNIEHVTVIPGITGTSSIQVFIPVAIKNSTKGREYAVRLWPGNSNLRNCLITDPFIALLAWMRVRGNRPGFLFCHVNEKNIIHASRQWTNSNFTDFLHKRLRQCGVGAASVQLYSGHSMKRGCVQLYRSLGVLDEHIMEIIQMTGLNAYANYCAAYNDCAPPPLTQFANLEDFLKHAETLRREDEVRMDHAEHFEQ